MDQRFGTVACNADVRGSILTVCLFFFCFFAENLSFLAGCDRLSTILRIARGPV